MSKIYVITAGDYSDYQIYGVATDPERAEAMRKIVDAHLGRYGEAIVEEYEDGAFEDERMSTIVPTEYYRVRLRTGSDKAAVWAYCGDANEPVEIYGRPWHSDFVPNEYYVKGIRADSEEKAIKIAIDEITKYRVEKGELGQ